MNLRTFTHNGTIAAITLGASLLTSAARAGEESSPCSASDSALVKTTEHLQSLVETLDVWLAAQRQTVTTSTKSIKYWRNLVGELSLTLAASPAAKPGTKGKGANERTVPDATIHAVAVRKLSLLLDLSDEARGELAATIAKYETTVTPIRAWIQTLKSTHGKPDLSSGKSQCLWSKEDLQKLTTTLDAIRNRVVDLAANAEQMERDTNVAFDQLSRDVQALALPEILCRDTSVAGAVSSLVSVSNCTRGAAALGAAAAEPGAASPAILRALKALGSNEASSITNSDSASVASTPATKDAKGADSDTPTQPEKPKDAKGAQPVANSDDAKKDAKDPRGSEVGATSGAGASAAASPPTSSEGAAAAPANAKETTPSSKSKTAKEAADAARNTSSLLQASAVATVEKAASNSGTKVELARGDVVNYGLAATMLRYHVLRDRAAPGRERSYQGAIDIIPGEIGFQVTVSPHYSPMRVARKQGKDFQIMSVGGILLLDPAGSKKTSLSLAATVSFLDDTVGLGVGFDLYRAVEVRGANGTPGSATAHTGLLSWATSPTGEITAENVLFLITLNASAVSNALFGKQGDKP